MNVTRIDKVQFELDDPWFQSAEIEREDFGQLLYATEELRGMPNRDRTVVVGALYKHYTGQEMSLIVQSRFVHAVDDKQVPSMIGFYAQDETRTYTVARKRAD